VLSAIASLRAIGLPCEYTCEDDSSSPQEKLSRYVTTLSVLTVLLSFLTNLEPDSNTLITSRWYILIRLNNQERHQDVPHKQEGTLSRIESR
jgi:hypothetical protein